jgi:ribonuclease J
MKLFDFNQKPKTGKLKLIPLGGVGNVTKNMYIYESESDILIVDCGIGFPDEAMPGIDLVIPDITYLEDKLQKIRGIVLTHGHDDHIAALPYILPKLKCPVFAIKLTAGLAQARLKEFNINTIINVVDENQPLRLGNFSIEFVHVTHSVPDAANLIIDTPAGVFYHGSDFKFDWTPVDGKFSDVQKIARAGSRGILCLLSDCLRSEKPGYTLSERVIEDTLEKEIRDCPGKFIVTTQSSNISRLQQAINVAIRHNRQICFVGRSLDQNVDVATRLGYLSFPEKFVIKVDKASKVPPQNLCLIVAGSQGQPDSALARIANREHKHIVITPGDVVVFSSDPIPGNENEVYSLIDTLTEVGAKVSYSDILDSLHVSGHAASSELMLMIGLAKAKYVLPIGGTIRHMKQYAVLAKRMGYNDKNILTVSNGDSIIFENGEARPGEKIEIKNIMVDGLGIGDVGNIVLRDRKHLAEDGIVLVVVPISQTNGRLSGEPDIISRGFVYMKEAGELIDGAKIVVKKSVSEEKVFNWQFIKKRIEENVEQYLFDKTKRRPMILAVIVEV